jgi:hypothetical protein
MRYRKAWVAIGLAFVALVVYLSLTHNPVPTPDVGFKLGHVAAYAWLMFWFSQIHRGTRARVALGLAFTAMGAVLEYVQGTTGYRTFAYSDMRDNAAGVVAGLVVALTPLGRVLPLVDRALARR